MVAVAVDIHIQAQEMERLRDETQCNPRPKLRTTTERIEQDTDRDFWYDRFRSYRIRLG